MKRLLIVLPGAIERKPGRRRIWKLRSAVRGAVSRDVHIISDREPWRCQSLTEFRASKPGQSRKAAVSRAIRRWTSNPRRRAYSFSTITDVVEQILTAGSIHQQVSIIDVARAAHARRPLSYDERIALAGDIDTQRSCGVVRRGDWRLVINEWLRRR